MQTRPRAHHPAHDRRGGRSAGRRGPRSPGSRRRERCSTRRDRATDRRVPRENGGYLRADDLAEFRSRYEDVVATRWRDFTIYTCGAWCQGPILARGAPDPGAGRNRRAGAQRPGTFTLVSRRSRRAFADREYHYGDPAFVDVPLAQLLGDRAHRRPRSPRSTRSARRRPAGAYRASQPSCRPRSRRTRSAHSARAADQSTCASSTTGQRVLGVAVGRRLDVAGHPRHRFVPSLRGLQSRPDPRHPSGVGTRQATAPDPQPRDRGPRRRQRHAVRLPGRRHAGAGDAAGRSSTRSVRHGTAGGGQRAAVLHLELPELVRAVRLPRRPTSSWRTASTTRLRRARSAAATTFVRWPSFTRDAAAVEAIYATRGRAS